MYVESKTILIVDDIQLMRTMLRRYLTMIARSTDADDAFEIVEAVNGREALHILSKREVDVVFLDLMMPEMDGITFLEQRKDDARAARVPVILTTALSEEAHLGRALELGAKTYIRKPFTVEAVERELAQVLGP